MSMQTGANKELKSQKQKPKKNDVLRKSETGRKKARRRSRATGTEELDRRLGPSAAKARQGAVSGAPVSERVFRLDLPGVDNWPKPEIVAIPPGTFLMGSPPNEERWDDYDGREEPQHKVTIEHPFALENTPLPSRNGTRRWRQVRNWKSPRTKAGGAVNGP